MNDDQLNDLKQFIDSRLSQTESMLDDKFDSKLESLKLEVLDGFGGIAETVEQIHELLETRYLEVNQRLKQLEQQSA